MAHVSKRHVNIILPCLIPRNKDCKQSRGRISKVAIGKGLKIKFGSWTDQ